MNASVVPAICKTETIEVSPERVTVDMSREQAELLREITAWPITIIRALTLNHVFHESKEKAGRRVLAELAIALDGVL